MSIETTDTFSTPQPPSPRWISRFAPALIVVVELGCIVGGLVIGEAYTNYKKPLSENCGAIILYEEPVEWLGNESLARWVEERVLELTYTAWDMQPFARDLGDEGSPFVWDEERRFVMRAELDAAYFHLYGVARGDVDYIMDSFRAFRNNDPSRFARTKALILELYDAMAKAAASGKPYETPLDPPPGRGPRHPNR